MPRKTSKVSPGVRKYGLKSNYSKETLEEALAKIRSGAMSRLSAAKHYNIPPVTLYHKLKEKHTKPVGKPTTFTREEEEAFKAHLLVLSDLGIPLSMFDFRSIVRDYLNSNKRVIPTFNNNLPGYEWGVLFLERNPELKEKVAHNIPRKRAQVTKEQIKCFFDNFEKEAAGVPPENIYNMDESGFHDNPGKKKLLFRRKSRHPEIIKNSTKSCYTVVFCGNAAGEVFPPFFIFKGKKLWTDWLYQAPSGSRMAVSRSGWIDTTVFEDWLERHFVPHVDKQEGRKILLCDNLSSHISPKALRICAEHNISFICLIPNSTHLLQPLDVGYFSALKTAWRKVLNCFRGTKRGKKVQSLPKSLFAQLVLKSLQNIENTAADNLKAGFRSCGLHPFSPSHVLDKLPSYTTQANARDSIGKSFMDYIEEIRQGDLNVQKGRKFQIPITSGKSVSVEEVEKFYEEKLKPKESQSKSKKRGRPAGVKNNKKKKLLVTEKAEEDQTHNDLNESTPDTPNCVTRQSGIQHQKPHDSTTATSPAENIAQRSNDRKPNITNDTPVIVITQAEIHTEPTSKELKPHDSTTAVTSPAENIEQRPNDRKPKITNDTPVIVITQEEIHTEPTTKILQPKVENNEHDLEDICCLDEVLHNFDDEIVGEYLVSSEGDLISYKENKSLPFEVGMFCLFNDEDTIYPGYINKLTADGVSVKVLRKCDLGGWTWFAKNETCVVNKKDVISVMQEGQIRRKYGKFYFDDDILLVHWGE